MERDLEKLESTKAEISTNEQVDMFWEHVWRWTTRIAS